MQNNPFQNTIDDLNNFKDNLSKAAENTEDVKKGDATLEEEKQEPDFLLFDAISESSIAILQLPSIQEGFKHLSENITEDGVKKLIEIMVIAMTHSAYNAITFYDGLLKEELIKQFDHYGDSLNSCIGKVNAHEGAIAVLKERVNSFIKEKQVDELNK